MKIAAAAIGAGAVLAMGALTAGLGGEEASAAVEIGGAGETSTETTAPSAPAIPFASPTVTAPEFGLEENG